LGAFAVRRIFKPIAIVAVSALCALLAFHGCRTFRADRAVRGDGGAGSYDEALKWAPGDASLWLGRGRLRHHAFGAADLDGALGDYLKALSLNPRLGRGWTGVADIYEQKGAWREAETAYGNAFRVHAFSPDAHWRAGNYFLRRGDLPRMYDCFRAAVQYDPSRLGIAVRTAWQVDGDRAGILGKLVPDRLRDNLAYFDFLVSQKELDLGRAAWERMLGDGVPDKYEFKASAAFGYIDQLLAAGRVGDAERVWGEALAKAGVPARAPAARWNESFEDDVLGGGFDWRVAKLGDARMEVASGGCPDGRRCLGVSFGNANVRFAHLSRIVPVAGSGEYALEYDFRAEGLTSDKRPYWSVQGHPERTCAELRTEPFPESSGWARASYGFSVGEGCRAIRLTLQRDTSSKIGNRIKGSLWVDAVRVRKK
jgi:hypothetical protein